jgi:hypothetical protein
MLDSTTILYAKFKSHFKYIVKIPYNLINRRVVPYLYIADPKTKRAHFFEPKATILIDENYSKIDISFSQSKEYSERVIFSVQ